MKLFLDFDDVLFHTDSFIRAKRELFARCGVSDVLYQETYEEAKSGEDEAVRMYDFEKHLRILERESADVRTDLIREGMESVFRRTSEFVFADAKDFLDGMRMIGAEMFVVSFGSPEFQAKKIEYSGIRPYFSDVFVGTDSKSAMIRGIMETLIPNEPVWFADDQPKFLEDVKKAYSKVKTVQIMRPEARWKNDRSPIADFAAKDLDELHRIIVSGR